MMRLTPFLVAAGVALANPDPPCKGLWKAPGPNDFRGPCPMLNTLANHQFLPHDGRNLTETAIIDAVTSALNFNASLGTILFENALIANPEPNATFFTLDQLNVHNLLEHDSSLSRSDAYWGNGHIFNQTAFDQSRAYWTNDLITADQLANAKVARQIHSKSFNPTYTFTHTMEEFSLGELTALIVGFGDKEAATTNRTFVEYFFQNERLPEELGWHKMSSVVNLEDILRLNEIIRNATSLFTTATPIIGRRDFHSGLLR